MTATPILETLAREFKTDIEHVRNALEMIDAGLTAPFIGRYRRSRVGAVSESVIRRLDRRRHEFEELDRRKGTILRLLEKEEGVPPGVLDNIRGCMDRFEVEDLFLPHRRPEPEVQLALDRGLGGLADVILAPVPRAPREAQGESPAEEAAEATSAGGAPGEPSTEGPSTEEACAEEACAEEGGTEAAPPGAPGGDGVAPESAVEAPPEVAAEATPEPVADAPAEPVAEVISGAAPEAAAVATAEAVPETTPEPAAETAAEATPEPASEPAPEPVPEATPEPTPATAEKKPAAPSRSGAGPTPEVLTAELARLCASYVSPDRGVHNESEALAGAMRIISDRLGRNARLRGTLRRMLRKHGILSVRPLVDDSRAGRHKGLLKIHQPMRQIQGNRLLAIRQAQKERVLTTRITVDRDQALQKVRAALGRHLNPSVQTVLDEVSARALDRRLLPMIEEDIRLELKERADIEALRFLAQHLRQLLLTPVLPGRRTVAGMDVTAKGDWVVALVDSDGVVIPTPEIRIETKGKDEAALGTELAAALAEFRIDAFALSSSKGSRTALFKVRQALAAGGIDAFPFIVTEAGLSSYANSEVSRKELPDYSVSQRLAISLARRLQDPLCELLKVDPRHLSLGAEQGLVSKANVRRVFKETAESCASHVGCDVNRAPVHFLAALPGLDRTAAERIVARRAETPIESREELRYGGLLDEAQWASSVGFLRVYGSPEPLDRSNLHPEQYVHARQLIESVGSTLEDGLGRMGITKGLRREDFEFDPDTWRDLMRELSHPGRDPRHRLHVPELLHHETDPATLTRDRVVEGVISNVTSFGAFVDVGLKQDAMIHISEVSEHYVRDARELLSVGQVVRARILDGSGQRITLSLKKVPREPRERRGRPGGGRREGGGGGRGRGRGRDDRGPRIDPNLRAAQVRRDGLGGAHSSSAGGRRGGPGRGGDRRRRDAGDERVDLRKVNEDAKKVLNNPFAAFFSGPAEEQPQPQAEAQLPSEPQPEPQPEPQAEVQPPSEPQPEPDPQPEAQPEPQAEVQPPSEPQPELDPQPEAQPEPQAEVQPPSEPQPEEPQAEPQAEPRKE